MDRETARKRAQVMLAYADGADIEFVVPKKTIKEIIIIVKLIVNHS